MRVHLVLITSDEKTIIDNVRLHLNPSLLRVFTDDMFSGSQSHSCQSSPSWVQSSSGSLLFRVCFRILRCCVLQAILDTCHSGTMLDLPHYHCNTVYVPWQSKGERRTMTMQNING
jgi:hypothetical protein